MVESYMLQKRHGLGRSLIEAAADNDALLCKTLLLQGADPNYDDPLGTHTALGTAVSHGSVEAVAMLLLLGADPSKSPNKTGSVPPLLLAATCPDTYKALSVTHQCAPIAVKLLKAGANVNVSYPSGSQRSVLHLVVEHGLVEVALASLKARANPNVLAAGSLTPLHLVSSSSKLTGKVREQLTGLLIKFGADPSLRDSRGRLPSEVVPERVALDETEEKKDKPAPPPSSSSPESQAEL